MTSLMRSSPRTSATRLGVAEESSFKVRARLVGKEKTPSGIDRRKCSGQPQGRTICFVERLAMRFWGSTLVFGASNLLILPRVSISSGMGIAIRCIHVRVPHEGTSRHLPSGRCAVWRARLNGSPSRFLVMSQWDS